MTKEKYYMQVDLRAGNLVSEAELEKLMEDKDFKLFTSKQLAKLLSLKRDRALRKQRSKGRSLFPFVKLKNRVFYPADLVIKTLHDNVVEAKLR